MRGMFVGSIRGVECLIRDKFANGDNNLLANGGPEKLGNRDSMLWSGYTHVPEYWPTGRLQKTQEGKWPRRISSNFPRFCGRACAKAQRLSPGRIVAPIMALPLLFCGEMQLVFFPCFLMNATDEIKHRQATHLHSLLHFCTCHHLLYFQNSWSWAAK